ncbi:DedA family protein [Tepidibacillus infernus]|uniref:VTT domain-containing protein n=1 Tax=Tepidibacillus decaturensis TaxID=1413211 RepID=A0A135L0X8_9BACI|nr:DedA family protein [Tepidibacillus decaturensis]KXG42634.1 hypothetical protein U473_00170 [Tepidibacillus decaturensis]
MEQLWDWIIIIFRTIGIPGLGVGLFLEGMGVPFPGETTMAFFGFLSQRGDYPFLLLVATASLGSWIGSWIAFYLGRTYGIGLLFRYGKYLFLKRRHIKMTMRLSRRFGVWVLVLGRHLPGVRTISSYMAGIGRMSWPVFLVYSLLGFVFWTTTWLAFGYIVANRWEQMVQVFSSWVAIIFLILFIGIGLIYYVKRYRKQGKVN